MVVRSVVRRSRLKELGVGRATFSAAGEPVPVGATVKIPSDKKIKATVTFENTGSKTVSGTYSVDIFYADSLSDSSGDPKTDYDTWTKEWEAHDYKGSWLSLDPGKTGSLTGNYPVDASIWSEGTKIDVGIVLAVSAEFVDSLKIADAIQIIAPALRVEITNVTFSEA